MNCWFSLNTDFIFFEVRGYGWFGLEVWRQAANGKVDSTYQTANNLLHFGHKWSHLADYDQVDFYKNCPQHFIYSFVDSLIYIIDVLLVGLGINVDGRSMHARIRGRQKGMVLTPNSSARINKKVGIKKWYFVNAYLTIRGGG